MKGKANWAETKQKWTNYWKHQNTGRPLMCVVARNADTEEAWQQAKASEKIGCDQICQGVDYLLPGDMMYHNISEKYRDAEKMVRRYRHFCSNHTFLGESFPNINMDFGPGTMAAYLGSEIEFRDDTVWFHPFVTDWDDTPDFQFNASSKWWQEHYALAKKLRELAGNDFYIGMPDVMANLDIVAAVRGAQDTLFDLYDNEDEIKKRLLQIADIYYDYYDRFYEVLANPEDGGTCYTVFQIWGPGKTVMLQCDFSAMISEELFREFVQKPLRRQARRADNVMYHLDGPDCMRHIDAIMEIDEIDALQYTSGDYGPDGTSEAAWLIYDKAITAGKSLWVKVYSGDVEDWIRNTEKLVHRYGSHSLFLHYPEMSMADAEKLLTYAEKNWSDIQGEITSN